MVTRFVDGIEYCSRCVAVHCDNKSAMQLSKNQVFHERTKYVNIKVYFIREVVRGGKVEIRKFSTDDNHSNMITKPLMSSKFEYCLELTGFKNG